jgi:uncharacterized protein YigA (DUF484 family)
MKYSPHICGDTGHKIKYCPKYSDMHNMSKNKIVKIIDKQVVVKAKVSNPSVHMVDVNMAITKNKVIKKHLFKDREPIKKKSVANWEKEQRLQQCFIKTIQKMQAKDPLEKLNQKEKTQWNTSWARLLKVEVSTKPIVP